MTTNQERDARLEFAKALISPDMTPEALATLRQFAGTASPLYRPGWKLWNWFFDTEYTSYPGFPAWVWASLVVVIVGVGVLWIVVMPK